MKKRHVATAVLALGLGMIGYVAGWAHASGIPATQPLTYSGVLTDLAGAPLAGTKTISVAMWDQATNGTQQCSSGPVQVTLAAGGFQVPLPDACATAVHNTPDLWIEVSVDSVSMGRFKAGAVPYALEASRASEAAGTLQTTLTTLQTSLTSLDTAAVKVTGDQTIAGDKTFTGTVLLSCPTGTVDSGAGFCMDGADRTEAQYADSLATCAGEGKVVCGIMQLCIARIRAVGNLGTVNYRVGDVMYFSNEGTHYFGGGGGLAPLNLPAACAGLIAAPGPNGGGLNFRCCRAKG